MSYNGAKTSIPFPRLNTTMFNSSSEISKPTNATVRPKTVSGYKLEYLKIKWLKKISD